MKKRKCAAGGVVVGPRSMQDQLIAIRPKFADGGRVDAAEEAMRRMASKYGTAVPPPSPPAAVAQPSAPATAAAQPTDRGLSSLPGQIQKRTDELNRLMDYDKPKPRGMAAGGIPGIDEPVSLAGPAPFRQDIGAGVGATAIQSGNLSGMPSAAGMTPQSQGFLGAADYSTGPKQGGFVSGDGTPRGVDQGQSPSTSREYAPGLSAARGISDTIAMNKAMTGLSMVDRAALSNPTNQPYMADGRLAQNGRTFVTPGSAAESSMLNAQTSALESLQKNLMAPLKLGSSANPNASGGFAATAQQRAALPDATQAQPVPAMPANPMDSPSRRSRGRQQFADGGRIIPVNIGQGLYQAIAQPIAEDWKQGNVAIKNVRDQYPTVDNLAGIHPAVAAAQLANDVMAGKVGADTAANVAQMIPIVRQANMLTKGAVAVPGMGRFAVNMPATIKKNMAITAGQVVGQPENAFADGGMVRFSGKGGPREDKIPVKVAGESIRVSDGESAVILPAKTAANPLAVQAIGQVIQQSNDGRAPDMGGKRFERGGFPVRQVPDEIDLARGQLETARAQAADNASRSAYKAELATRDAMTARAAESANMQAAIDGAKSQPAINPKALPAQPIYQPNWTAGNNAPVLEGVVETADEVRAKAATPPRQAIGAPQPGTAVTPRTVDWAPGGNPPAGGPVQARSVDWTYGQNGGPAQQPGMAAQAARPVQQIAAPQAVPTPQPVAQPPQSAAYRAGHAYAKAGGATGLASKAMNVVAPAVAAVQTLGDNGIKVAGLRESDPGYNESSGIPRTVGAAKEIALRAGDWGTKGLDILGGWALPSGEESFNNLYRQRVGLLDGVTAPTTADVANQQRIDAANAAPQAAVQKAGMAAQAIGAPDPRIAANTGNAGEYRGGSGMITAKMGAGFDPTKLQMADGYGMASTASGNTLFTGNMSPNQYTAADGTQNARWEQTQAYLDAQQRLQADKMRAAEMQATRQGMNPVQAIAATQGMAQSAQSAPLDRAVVQQQIDADKVAAQNAKDLQDLYAAHKAATSANEQERIAATIRARTGKSDGKPVVVDLGDEFSPDGMMKRGRGQVALDPITHQPISLTGSAPAALALPKTFAEYAAAVRAHPSNKGVKIDDAQLKKDYEARYGAVK